MKATSRFIGYAALLSGVLLAAQLQAIDAGPSLWLDRYTLETNGTLVHDSGNLLANGRFRVLFSEIVDPFYIDPTIDFTPISGRPVILEELYSGYKSAGVVPHWTRSRDDFYVGGYLPYVIVSIAGGQDPNPTITITQQPQSDRK